MDLDRIERTNLAISAGAIATSAALAPSRFAVSVALGTAMQLANYRALRRSTEALFQGILTGAGPWTAGFGLRFGFLMIAITVALWAGAHPVGLVIGLSALVPAAVIGAWLTPPPPVDPTTLVPPDDQSWDDWNPWLAREREPADEEDE